MPTPTTLSVALKYLATAAHTFPHSNTDGACKEVGFTDTHAGAWCLGCTVGETLQTLGVKLDLDEDCELLPGAFDAAQQAWTARLMLPTDLDEAVAHYAAIHTESIVQAVKAIRDWCIDGNHPVVSFRDSKERIEAEWAHQASLASS